MTKQNEYVSDVNVTLCGSNKPSSTPGEDIEYSVLIPIDVIISNILSRLPAKSIAQCRCVSKLWSSRIRRPYYNLLFPIKLPAPPQILFTIEYEGELLFYSSPDQPSYLNENKSLVATLHHRTSGTNNLYGLCRPIHGLVCRHHTEEDYTFAVICNPITGESLTLPKLRMAKNARYYFGYDPIDKQFKVLRITWSPYDYQVLTIGTAGNENLLWREIQCCTRQYPLNDSGICIDGVLYYSSRMEKFRPTIVCFDVRSEKFNFLSVDKDLATSISFTLIDYKGKLGAYRCSQVYHNPFELWVLEDVEKHIWSKQIYRIPFLWFNEMSYMRPAGMIGSCEIVLYQKSRTSAYTYPFHIFYYNLESNVITRVILEDPLFKEFPASCRVHAFTNYVEDVKLM